MNVNCQIRYIARPSPEGLKEEQHGTTKDISAGGICIKLDLPAPEGTYLEFRTELPGSEQPIEAIAEVVWSRKAGDMHYNTGIRFMRIIEEDRLKIYNYIEKNLEE